MRLLSGWAGVFEHDDDHAKAGIKAESHAEREDSASLNQSLSFVALGERRAPERSNEAQSEA